MAAPTPDRTNRLERYIRWTRLFLHVGVGLMLTGIFFPRCKKSGQDWIIKWWSAKLLRILNIVLSVRGEAKISSPQVVLVANHISWLDVFVINAAHPSRFIAKSEIADWPVAGSLATNAGTIFIRRAKRTDAAKTNDAIAAQLRQSNTVAIFPEGTTTAGDKLLKFHTSLFEPAVANQATIAPVALRYRQSNGEVDTSAAFIGELTFSQSMGQIIAQKSIIAEVIFAPVIAPVENESSHANCRRSLAHAAEAAIAKILNVPVHHERLRFNEDAA
jgi:1-acyl-sn-glycerol-3-phosphate acyltransferase